MSETPIERMKRKIVALLRHSKGTNNLKEAASFAAKARELMEEYAIEVAPSEEEYERVGETAIEDNQLGMTWFNMGFRSKPYINLMAEVADFYGCYIVLKKGQFNMVRVYGRESARITCCLMFKFFLGECKRIAQQWHEEKGWDVKDARLDMINGLSIRLNSMRQAGNEPKSFLPSLPCPIEESKSMAMSEGVQGYVHTSAESSVDAVIKAGAISLTPQTESSNKKKALS